MQGTKTITLKFTLDVAELEELIKKTVGLYVTKTVEATTAVNDNLVEVPTITQEPEPKTEAPTFTMTRNEIKAYCTNVQGKVDILTVLKEFGVTRFSALPDDKLEAFYNRVGELMHTWEESNA